MPTAAPAAPNGQVALRASLWKRARRAVSNGSTLHLKMHGPGKTPC
jgi:hypothetical protein